MGSEERPPAWQADAWALERAYPQHFSRPETQLSVNQGVSTGPTNIVVVGPERAAILANRHEQIRARTIERLERLERTNGNRTGDRQNGGGNGQQAAREAESSASAELSLLEKPPPAPFDPASRQSASWWAQFIFPGAPIPRPDAILALRSILGELRISVDQAALMFQNDPVSQGTFTSTLERLTGSDLGWRTLVQIYEREQQRASH